MRYAFSDFVLDVEQRRLFSGDRELHLQPKAFDFLRVLLESRPRALAKDEILTAVWPGTFVSENNLATVVRDLRTALGDDAQEPRFIRTIYGFGYAFVGELEATAATTALSSRWRLIHEHREIRLREGDNILGRMGHDVIVIESPTVSRHHACIRVNGDTATVEDLGSKNGTWLKTTAVTGAAVPLEDAAELRMGSVVTTVRYDAKSPTTETARSSSLRAQ